LNLEWQENDGGELALYLPEGEKRVLPIGGRLVCFESDKIEHAVLTANRNRLSLTGWLKR
jgi:SM-20-related protein